MAHELTHALQDQHVGLKTLPIEVDRRRRPRRRHRQSVVEGDATLAMMAWMFLKMGCALAAVFSKSIASDARSERRLELDPGRRRRRERSGVHQGGVPLPVPRRAEVLHRDRIEEQELRRPVDRALKAPPLVDRADHPSRQVLGRGTATFRCRIVLPDLSGDARHAEAHDRTRSASCSRGSCSPRRARQGARQRPPRQDGTETATSLYGKAGAPDALVWVSTWDTSEDADEFEAALKSWLAALNPGKTSEESDVTSARFIRDDGTLDTIARKGSDVILLRGIPKETPDPGPPEDLRGDEAHREEEGVISCETASRSRTRSPSTSPPRPTSSGRQRRRSGTGTTIPGRPRTSSTATSTTRTSASPTARSASSSGRRATPRRTCSRADQLGQEGPGAGRRSAARASSCRAATTRRSGSPGTRTCCAGSRATFPVDRDRRVLALRDRAPRGARRPHDVRHV